MRNALAFSFAFIVLQGCLNHTDKKTSSSIHISAPMDSVDIKKSLSEMPVYKPTMLDSVLKPLKKDNASADRYNKYYNPSSMDGKIKSEVIPYINRSSSDELTLCLAFKSASNKFLFMEDCTLYRNGSPFLSYAPKLSSLQQIHDGDICIETFVASIDEQQENISEVNGLINSNSFKVTYIGKNGVIERDLRPSEITAIHNVCKLYKNATLISGDTAYMPKPVKIF